MTQLVTRGRAASVALVALVLAAPSVAQADPVHHQLTDAGLLPQQARFAELSIVQHKALYRTVRSGGRVRVSIEAGNPTDRTTRYHWSATVATSGSQVQVDGGRLSLSAYERKTIPLRFTIRDCRLRNKISVRLRASGQPESEVHYWVLPRGSSAARSTGGATCAA